MNNDKTRLFSSVPVPTAVISLAMPAIISQLIALIYNMADTFFVGRMGSPAAVAAVSISMPAFVVLTAISNLFGIGGASLMSRCLGMSDRQGAGRAATFCINGGFLVSLAYGLLLVTARPTLLPLFGAGPDTYDLASTYLLWTTVIGSVPTVLSSLLAHLVRAEGSPRQASFGVAMGGVLNIALDPIFIFPMGMGLAGAAAATMLSNAAAMLYYLIYLYRRRGATVISFRLQPGYLNRGTVQEVLCVGVPSCIMSLMSVISNATLTHLIAGYSTEAIAGMGIAKKIDMMAYCTAQGLAQGVLPLLGYNFAAGSVVRVRQTLKFTAEIGMCAALIMTTLMYFLAPQITATFIADPQTVQYGRQFLRIICFICPTTCLSFLIITLFQATGQKVQPLVLSFLRKGCLDAPLMVLLNRFCGVSGIAWATPLADWTCFAVSAVLVVPFLRGINSSVNPE